MPELLKWGLAYFATGPVLLLALELITGALKRAFLEGLKPENFRPYTSTNGLLFAIAISSLIFGPIGVAVLFAALILEGRRLPCHDRKRLEGGRKC